MSKNVRDMVLGDCITGKALMPMIPDENLVLTLIEERPDKGHKFAGIFMGIWLGNFVAEPVGKDAVRWRRETKNTSAGRDIK